MSQLTEKRLKKLYWEENLSQAEIAKELEVSQAGVSRAMERHGIETRSQNLATSMAKSGPSPKLDNHGYVYVQTRQRGEIVQFRLHRLVAVAEYGLDQVAEKVVHHKNNISWDNRPENLELLDDSQHKQRHADARRRGEGGEFA